MAVQKKTPAPGWLKRAKELYAADWCLCAYGTTAHQYRRRKEDGQLEYCAIDFEGKDVPAFTPIPDPQPAAEPIAAPVPAEEPVKEKRARKPRKAKEPKPEAPAETLPTPAEAVAALTAPDAEDTAAA